MKDYLYLYCGTFQEARRDNNVELWKESRQENIRCKEAVEQAIGEDFDGMYLKGDCAKKVIEDYGFKRLAWVLANTVQQKSWDGRFSSGNREWAKQTYIPEDLDSMGLSRNQILTVESHPAVLDGFISQFRREVEKLGLFSAKHCEENSSQMDYEGKVLVLSPDTLRESCWKQEDQLWLAFDGFGCSPTARGQSVRCVCLGDGEETVWNRSEFIGILKEEFLPGWAKKELEEYFSDDMETPEIQL